jgi:hypothetical protein
VITDLIGPLLVAAGFGAYMATNVWFGRFRRVPWEFIAVSALGVLHALGQLNVRPGSASVTSALVTFGLFGFLLWFYFRFSMYGPARTA